MSLQDIQPFVQNVAEAIASVLQVEVEIADEGLLRIAGTGLYRAGVLRRMHGEDQVYREVLRSGQARLVREPGFDGLCRGCNHYHNCPEKAEIACPIVNGGDVVGIMALVAFSEEQKGLLLAEGSLDRLLSFLKNMSELLISKLDSIQMAGRIKLALNQLSAVMDHLDKGVLSLDDQNRLLKVNEPACLILGTGEADLAGRDVFTLFPSLRAALESPDELIELGIETPAFHKRVYARFTPLTAEGVPSGAVLVLQDPRDVQRLVLGVPSADVPFGFKEIIGGSEAIQLAKKLAARVAGSDSTVLLAGESGTGKELFARAIHAAGPRRTGPFVAINCGAIPDTLLESELFGYEDGAFTGARRGGRAGKFELAHGGTLFLDEVGDLPLHLQVKLLRVLQERYIERVGGNKRIEVSLRVIAAANKSLEELVRQGLFREDLFYRLSVIPLTIPPLRERPEDVVPLARHFLDQYTRRMDKGPYAMTPEFQTCLREYPWPGNVRELSNIIEYAVNMADGPLLTRDGLPAKLRRAADAPWSGYNLAEVERRLILEVVEKVGDKEHAAGLLGISRATLYRKLRQWQAAPGRGPRG
jgi:transcriptional regulator with PAS, ATPase and Fis domain